MKGSVDVCVCRCMHVQCRCKSQAPAPTATVLPPGLLVTAAEQQSFSWKSGGRRQHRRRPSHLSLSRPCSLPLSLSMTVNRREIRFTRKGDGKQTLDSSDNAAGCHGESKRDERKASVCMLAIDTGVAAGGERERRCWREAHARARLSPQEIPFSSRFSLLLFSPANLLSQLVPVKTPADARA